MDEELLPNETTIEELVKFAHGYLDDEYVAVRSGISTISTSNTSNVTISLKDPLEAVFSAKEGATEKKFQLAKAKQALLVQQRQLYLALKKAFESVSDETLLKASVDEGAFYDLTRNAKAASKFDV